MINVMHNGCGFKPRISYSDGRTFVPDWLFVNVPKRRESLDALVPSWNISQKYEDISDIPSDDAIEDMAYPRIHDIPIVSWPGQVHPDDQTWLAAAKNYGRVKVEGKWVYSFMMKMRDYSYHYFYHYFYTGPKKERPKNLWPHCDPESPVPFTEGIT